MSIDYASLAALVVAMLALAALPSVSVLAVTSRSLSGGFRHGAAVSAGVVLGDILFILIALYGLSLLLSTAGSWTGLLKFAAAAYLLWMARSIWRSRHAATSVNAQQVGIGSLGSSLLSGLLLTLGDQKAIFFYLGFFPAFVDLSVVTTPDILLIILVTILTVGGVKLTYAWLVSRAGRAMLNSPRAGQLGGFLNSVAVLMLVLAAAMIILRY